MILAKFSQYGFPFHPPGEARGSPVMHRLRIAGRRELQSRRAGWKQLAAGAAMLVLWPVGAAFAALRDGRRHGASPGRMTDAWWMAVRHNVPPLEYYLHRLWEPARRSRLDDYLYWSENGSTLTALNRAAGWHAGPDPVADKGLFFAFCRTHRLPTPDVHGVWGDAGSFEDQALPQADLFLKPLRGRSGTGVERWLWRNGAFRRGAQSLQPAGLRAHVAHHARRHAGSLVQSAIAPHPAHAPVTGNAPMGARIVTGRRRNGTVEVVDAMAMWPQAGHETVQGGYLAMVDIDSGRLGRVFDPTYPVDIPLLEDSALPGWASALAAVRTGHAHLPHFVFLGWDLAFGPDGPVLLEANSGWGSFYFQVLSDRPIADTAFASIAADYL